MTTKMNASSEYMRRNNLLGVRFRRLLGVTRDPPTPLTLFVKLTFGLCELLPAEIRGQ